MLKPISFENFVALMKSEFEMSLMGELSFFLGLQIKQSYEGIFISQRKIYKRIDKKIWNRQGQSFWNPNESNHMFGI